MKKRIGILFCLILLSVSFVSAVWWNPMDWFDESRLSPGDRMMTGIPDDFIPKFGFYNTRLNRMQLYSMDARILKSTNGYDFTELDFVSPNNPNVVGYSGLIDMGDGLKETTWIWRADGSSLYFQDGDWINYRDKDETVDDLPQGFIPDVGYLHKIGGGRIVLWDGSTSYIRRLDDARWRLHTDGGKINSNLPLDFAPVVGNYYPGNGGRVVLWDINGIGYRYNPNLANSNTGRKGKFVGPLIASEMSGLPSDFIPTASYYDNKLEANVMWDWKNAYAWDEGEFRQVRGVVEGEEEGEGEGEGDCVIEDIVIEEDIIEDDVGDVGQDFIDIGKATMKQVSGDYLQLDLQLATSELPFYPNSNEDIRQKYLFLLDTDFSLEGDEFIVEINSFSGSGITESWHVWIHSLIEDQSISHFPATKFGDTFSIMVPLKLLYSPQNIQWGARTEYLGEFDETIRSEYNLDYSKNYPNLKIKSETPQILSDSAFFNDLDLGGIISFEVKDDFNQEIQNVDFFSNHNLGLMKTSDNSFRGEDAGIAMIFARINDCYLMPNPVIVSNGRNKLEGGHVAFILQEEKDSEGTIEIMEVLASVQADLFGYYPHDGQLVITEDAAQVVGSPSFSFPTPVPLFLAGELNDWFYFSHENGHHFHVENLKLLQMLKDFYGESIPSESAHYAIEEVLLDQIKYGIPDSAIESLTWDRDMARENFLKDLEEYERQGAPFEELLTYDNEDFDPNNVFNGMILRIKDKYGRKVTPRFFKVFQPSGELVDVETLNLIQPRSVDQSHTMFVVAWSIAANDNLRPMFREWNYPIDDTYFDEVYPVLQGIVENDYLSFGSQTEPGQYIENILSEINIEGFSDEDSIKEISEWIQVNVIEDEFNQDILLNDRQLGSKTAESMISLSENAEGCTDFGVMFVTLARAKGYPTIFVDTYTLDFINELEVGHLPSEIEGHVFVNIYYGGGWHIYNPTNQFFLEPEYGGGCVEDESLIGPEGCYVWEDRDREDEDVQYVVTNKGLDFWDIGFDNRDEANQDLINSFLDCEGGNCGGGDEGDGEEEPQRPGIIRRLVEWWEDLTEGVDEETQPTSPEPQTVCGDGKCEGEETRSRCPSDCGNQLEKESRIPEDNLILTIIYNADDPSTKNFIIENIDRESFDLIEGTIENDETHFLRVYSDTGDILYSYTFNLEFPLYSLSETCFDEEGVLIEEICDIIPTFELIIPCFSNIDHFNILDKQTNKLVMEENLIEECS